jgi:hypothetical protein
MTEVERWRPSLGAPLNRKVGITAHTWSIPALDTCPGASPECVSCCYALSGFLSYKSVRESHKRNEMFSRTPEFADWMRAQLVANGVRLLRVHVAGDFYDSEYAAKWLAIMRQSPRVRFWAYTRSWRAAAFAVPDRNMVPTLTKIAELPNVALWLSEDVSTGTPPADMIPGARRAFMARRDKQLKQLPQHPQASLIFRNQTSTVVKRADGVLVCPAENGTAPQVKMTCGACQLCFNPAKAQHLQVATQLPIVQCSPG